MKNKLMPFTKFGLAAQSLVVSFGLLTTLNPVYAEDGPWRLSDALGLSENFTLSGEHQARFEHYDGTVQLGVSNNDKILFLRTTLKAEYNTGSFSTQLEIQDAGQQLADKDADIRNIHASVIDILQANVGYTFGTANTSEIRIGRFTQDWGSRTLVARNRFRNAINTFDGISFVHKRENGNEFKFLSTQPVRRTPRDRLSLLDNDRQTDKSSSAQRYHGVFASLPSTLPNILPSALPDLELETYYLLLQEKDTSTLETANRHLHTFGFRVSSAPELNGWDINLESIFQSGNRRASSNPIDTQDLDHSAFFQRAELAYSFNVPSKLRAIFEFNYASGDEDPMDQDSGRFDSLFGVTAFEFGPVALYAPFNRSNLISPGVRLTATPWRGVSLMADYRHFWLSERKDSWGRTGQRDITGDTDSYLGQHLELKVSWAATPGNIRVDSGLVLLDAENLANTQTAFFYVGSKIDF
jgi:hypothetical protein